MAAENHRPILLRAARVHPAPGESRPGTGEAAPDAVLIRSGRIEAVGAVGDLEGLAPDAERVELEGCTITPGLTDSHVHLVEWGLARRMVDLTGAPTPESAAEALAREAGPSAERGDWVRGIGWDAHRFEQPPHRRHLDRHFPDRPVLLQSHDLHSLWANGPALEAAGIGRETPDPEGGRIERDGRGEPTGVVRDNAMPLLYSAAPAPDDGARRSAVLDGQAELHRYGVTGVHTVEPESLGLLESIRSAGRLRLRVLQHLPIFKLDEAIRLGIRSGFGGDWIRIGGIKMFLDGALGSCTAWLREPYDGTDDDRGVSTLPPAEFRDAVRRGSAAGLAMTVHAIGDAAVALALDVLGGDQAELPGPVPHRIEHAQLVAPDLLDHPAWRRLVASVQPQHLMSDGAAADRQWGERARWAYAFASIEAAGAVLALGSDIPVEPPDPRQGIYAAVVRKRHDGSPGGGWYPEERIPAERALAGYTTGAARAAGDRRQGRLEAGSFADLVVWDRDPLAVPAEELPEARIRMTMVDGETVWTDD